MPTLFRPFTAVLLSVLLASCGGGGGGGDSGGTTATPSTSSTTTSNSSLVLISTSNAPAVAATAFDVVSGTDTTQGLTALVTGVSVESEATAPMPALPVLLTSLARILPRPAGSAVAAGVAIDQTVTCPQGGTVNVRGAVSSNSALTAGDTLTISANACRQMVINTATTMNGSLTLAVTAGSMPDGATAFDVTLRFSTSSLRMTQGTTSILADGDMLVRLQQTAANRATWSVTSTLLNQSRTVNGSTRSVRLENSTQSLRQTGISMSAALDGTVQVSSSSLSSTPVRYTVRTLAPLSWNIGEEPTAGQAKVTGANNTSVTLMVATTTATLALDTDGDGAVERNQVTSLAALRALL